MNKITAAIAGPLWCSLVLSGQALAQEKQASELGIVVGAGIEAHDNALLVEEEEKSDVERIGSIGLDFTKPEGKLQMDVGYVAERRDYLHDSQDDETALNGDSSLTWLALPRLLDFTLFHQSSQQRVDRRESDVSTNRESRNVLGAAANLRGNFTSVDTLIFSPGYTHVNVEGSAGLDSERSSGTLSYVHRTSQVSDINVTVSHSAVDTEIEANDYDFETATLGYTTRLSRVSYAISAGGNKVKRDVGEDVDGFLGRAGIEYVGSGLSWGGSYVQQLTDSGIGLSTANPGIGDFQSSDGNVGEFDILESTEVELHATYELTGSSEIGASLGYVEQDYDVTLQDEQDVQLGLSYRYKMNSRWQTGIRGNYTKAKFKDDPDGLENDDSQVELFADYQPLPRVTVHLGVGRDGRNSNLEGQDYEDLFAVAMLSYKVY